MNVVNPDEIMKYLNYLYKDFAGTSPIEITKDKQALLKKLDRYKDLLSISFDLTTVKTILTDIEQREKEGTCNHVYDYYGLLILYRKCWENSSNKRRECMGRSVLNRKALEDTSIQQKGLHEKLMNIANKRVAHTQIEDPNERVSVFINTQRSKLYVFSSFIPPLSCEDYRAFHSLIEVIQNNVIQQIQECEKSILKEINS